MTYIENIFLCLAIPMILSLFFIKGRARRYTLFVIIGMGGVPAECLRQQLFYVAIRRGWNGCRY